MVGLFVLACVGALLLTPWGAASGFFLFTETTGAPGDRIIARTGGEGAFSTGSRQAAYRVYFAPVEAADDIDSAADARLTLIGQVRVDADGNGRLVFRVPDVSPGRYVSLVYCVRCLRQSGARALLPFGPFAHGFVVTGAADRWHRWRLIGFLTGTAFASAALGYVAAVVTAGRRRTVVRPGS